MDFNRLYELAFAYKKTKLWKDIWDNNLFAVKLSCGEIGYISVMGAAGEHNAIAVYVGDEGVSSLIRIYDIEPKELSPFELREAILQQDCLQCALEDKDELLPEEYEAVKSYAKEHNISLRGKQAYPQFKKYSPNCLPWMLQDERDEQILCEAVEASIEMAHLIAEGVLRVDRWHEVPMLEKKDGGYEVSFIPMLDSKPVILPEPKVTNDIALAKLKRAKRKGMVECNIIRLTEPIQREVGEVPVFPVMLIVAEPEDKEILPMPPITDYEDRAGEYLHMLIDALVAQDSCPKTVKVCNKRTYLFMKDLCAGANIVLTMVDELPSVADFEEEFMNYLSGDKLDEGIIDMLMDMDEEQLAQLPKEMLEELCEQARDELLPVELEMKLDNAFQKAADDGKLVNLELVRAANELNSEYYDDEYDEEFDKGNFVPADDSYVISVSYGTGCYRHIRIATNATLWDLHFAILCSFEMIDEHLHAFFMDNRLWSKQRCYFGEEANYDYPTTEDAVLSDIGLEKDMKFKYLYDFGSEVEFSCKVLRIEEVVTDSPRVIRSRGIIPDTYSDIYEDMDDDTE